MEASSRSERQKTQNPNLGSPKKGESRDTRILRKTELKIKNGYFKQSDLRYIQRKHPKILTIVKVRYASWIEAERKKNELQARRTRENLRNTIRRHSLRAQGRCAVCGCDSETFRCPECNRKEAERKKKQRTT